MWGGGRAASEGRRVLAVKQGVNMVNNSSATKTGSHYLIDRKLTPNYLIGRKLTPKILWTGSWCAELRESHRCGASVSTAC